MSAIFGIVRFDAAPALPGEIDRMGRTIAHHGPDGRNTATDGAAAMGHCLLRVNREDAFEAQPLIGHDVMLVADIRLDNRDTLAEALGIAEGELCDMPDSAMLLAAYRRWGDACTDHLLGDFTFAIWNAGNGSLLLGRDHMGQRGLFYHHGTGFLAFATDVKALWAIDGVPRQLSDRAIGRGLLMAIDPIPGSSLFEGICVLPNAATLRMDRAGSCTVSTYWEPHAAPEHLGRDEAYYLQAYRSVVEEAVACRVRRLTRAPALCFSGGFDSGSIAAFAGPIVAAQGRKIVAVSSVLGASEKRLRIRDARAMVDAYRSWPFLDIHHYVQGEHGVFDDLEASFATTHFSSGAHYVRRGMYRVAAAQGTRLMMDGQGGDYTVNVLAGAMLGRLLRRGKLRDFAREFRMRMRATGRPARRVLRLDVIPALMPMRVISWGAAARRGFVPEWWLHPIAKNFARSLFIQGVVDPTRLRGGSPVHNRWQQRWLHILRGTAQAAPLQPALAAELGLQFTRPFHDKRVVELGLAIPETLQFRDGLERYLARQALRDLLPAELLARGPGNDAENPDMFRLARNTAPTALAEIRDLDRGGRLSRYVDFDKLARMIANADESKRPHHHRLAVAQATIGLARFIAWFDRTND
jgi:asparagine synthase (glutamine-hydrolysing)